MTDVYEGVPRHAATATDAPDPRRRFRRTAARFATGVTVVSTVRDGAAHAMTVNAFTTVSMDPLLVLVSLGRRSRTRSRIVDSGVFTVSVLAAHQSDVASRFADSSRPDGADAFAGVPTIAARGGAPVVAGSVAYFDCVVDAVHPAGDHSIVVGRVDDFAVLSDDPPLVFADSRFAALR